MAELRTDAETGLCWLEPEWDAPAGVRACAMTRLGGHSQGQWSGLNVSLSVGDDAEAVAANRALLSRALNLPSEPLWLNQVHGCKIVEHPGVFAARTGAAAGHAQPEADGMATNLPGRVCVIVSADCLPVFFATDDGDKNFVGLVHVGWRGLAGGILPSLCEFLTGRYLIRPGSISVWLGPAIGAQAFEVGEDVHRAIVGSLGVAAGRHLAPGRDAAHWQADLYALARMQLEAAGIERIFGGDCCTHTRDDLFFSHRRVSRQGGRTGRQANLIWLTSCGAGLTS